MTVIVGLPYKGRVYLGGDARGSTAGGKYDTRSEPKVWKRDGLVFGGTTSFRELQILQYRLRLPEPPADAELWPWLVNDFVDALRTVRKEAGADTKHDSGRESSPVFMLGLRGRLFVYESDYQVHEQSAFAVGCGDEAALGSLFTSAKMKSPVKRVELALASACEVSAYCGPPFTIVHTS